MKKPENSIIIIFGASGDLTKRKLIPALYELYTQDYFCSEFAILGVSRTEFSDEEFRVQMSEGIQKYSENKNVDEKLVEKFVNGIYYSSIQTDDPKNYHKLISRIKELKQKKNISENIVYYLSTPPKLYDTILDGIRENSLNKIDGIKNHKIVIEKPFGYDLKSAKKLNEKLHKIFDEESIFRIDHYLGKETVQNILVLRFSNGIFEPLWNRNFVDHVEITSAEFIGVENRGGYYDGIGALRDMVQNHMLQVAAFIAMEPPARFETSSVRNETIKVFQSLRSIENEEIKRSTIRGQYIESIVRGENIYGYRDEKGVDRNSKTETFAAMKFYIDNWRWGGVPFFIRAGKRLPTKVTEAVIHFKKTPHHLFSYENEQQNINQLIIRIQPDEGILIKFGIKSPGSGFRIQNVNMDFHYSDISDSNLPAAYERLLLDCLLGDSTLFTRADAIEECWRFVDPIIDGWQNDPSIKIFGYPSGTWGPKESFELFNDSLIEWRYPCKNLTDDGLYCEL